MQTTERKVICVLEKGYFSEKDDRLGKLRVLFEIFPDGSITPVNQKELFCETEQIFVTAGYNEIKERFGESVFEAKCVMTNFEVKEGDCRYVTRANSCEEIRGLMISQLFKIPLPDISQPTINLTERPQSKIIFLENEGVIYGPFGHEIETDSINEQYILTLKSITTPINKIPPFHIVSIKKEKIDHLISENKKQGTYFLGNVKLVIENSDSAIDFISDEQIISNYGNKIALNSDIRNFNKGTITQIRKHYSSSQEYRTFPQRFARFFQCLERAELWDETRKELFDNFLANKTGKEILTNYIEKNKEDYFKEEKQLYIEKLRKDTQKQEGFIKELEDTREKLEAEIRKKSRERDELAVNSTEQLNNLTIEEKNKIEQSISSKKRELDDLSNQIFSLEEKYSLFNSIDKLKDEIDDLERERDRCRDRKTKMQDQVEDVAKKLKESNEALTSRLVQLKPDVDALCGIRPKTTLKSLDYNVKVGKLNLKESTEDIREELIDNVLESLNSQGRKVDYYTAANLLTTIAQCQFTLFSGLPGTGKTSLAKMLGTSLGLKNRFLNIPVARGWTSYRDILGFYNALSQSYTSSSSGLFELLQYLNLEQRDKIDGALSIILLDEFNLSQPEHYFSPFLEMADPESKRVLATGNPDEPYFNIPLHLKFIGTLNQDESVQILTPRLLDRAAIINFDEFESDYEINVLEFGTRKESIVEPISGKKFIEIFQANSLEMPQDIESVLQTIVAILKNDDFEFGNPINISYRKIKSIRSYHNVAGPMMYIQSRYAALDYAVSQHVIPLLNGYGPQFGKRLENLLRELPDEMEKSRKHLSKLINYGNQNMFGYGMSI